MLLSYGQYCRFRALLKRFQSQESLVFQLDRFARARQLVQSTAIHSIKVFFCRETFEERQLREKRSLSEGEQKKRIFDAAIKASVDSDLRVTEE